MHRPHSLERVGYTLRKVAFVGNEASCESTLIQVCRHCTYKHTVAEVVACMLLVARHLLSKSACVGSRIVSYTRALSHTCAYSLDNHLPSRPQHGI
jgi:hypothetical protein